MIDALNKHLESTAPRIEFALIRNRLPQFRADLDSAFPALRHALDLKDADVRACVFALLGRIIGFSRSTNNSDLHKALSRR